MNKRILNFLLVLAGCGAITGSCKKEDSGVPYTYTSQVTVVPNGSLDEPSTTTSNSSKYSIELQFSTDGGITYTEYPKLNVGQKYKVRLYDQDKKKYLTSAKDFSSSGSFDFDWSGSTPAPNGSATDESAEFTVTSNSKIMVKINDTHCATDTKVFSGAWDGDEGTVTNFDGVKTTTFAGSTDSNGLAVDASNANKVWLYNIFGNGNTESAYMLFSTSTAYPDQTITMPSQSTPGGYTVSGSGKYDQCRQMATLDLTYAYIDSVSYSDTSKVRVYHPWGDYDSIVAVTPHKYNAYYKWTYSFAKSAVQPTYCAYVANSWTGAWIGAEGVNTQSCGSNFNGSNDNTTITQDSSNPNKFYMTNFWGDGAAVVVNFTLNPSIGVYDQNISVPAQTTSEGGKLAAATGSYDQCAKTFKFKCSYSIGGCTYNWTYNFHR